MLGAVTSCPFGGIDIIQQNLLNLGYPTVHAVLKVLLADGTALLNMFCVLSPGL